MIGVWYTYGSASTEFFLLEFEALHRRAPLRAGHLLSEARGALGCSVLCGEVNRRRTRSRDPLKLSRAARVQHRLSLSSSMSTIVRAGLVSRCSVKSREWFLYCTRAVRYRNGGSFALDCLGWPLLYFSCLDLPALTSLGVYTRTRSRRLGNLILSIFSSLVASCLLSPHTSGHRQSSDPATRTTTRR